jgi:hypothetical protein
MRYNLLLVRMTIFKKQGGQYMEKKEPLHPARRNINSTILENSMEGPQQTKTII